MTEFMDPTHVDAFKGMEKKAISDFHGKDPIECPLCHGYGGWHLELDAYGPGRHFNASCSQCNGWGYVEPGEDAECVHDMKEISQEEARHRGIMHFGMCYHVVVCKKCGKVSSYDSSD